MDQDLEALEKLLLRVPSVSGSVGTGRFEDGNWWAKFCIDIEHRLAWHVVQELGHVLNSVSLDERLPTMFMPVSPPPYMNGGPQEFLSWIIESRDASFTPSLCVEWLEERLPRPVEDTTLWAQDE